MTTKPTNFTTKLLVVDDDPSVLSSVTAILSLKYAVGAVSSVQDARILLADGSYDVLITDYLMPQATGIDLIRTCRRDCPHMMCILVTAFADDPVVRNAEKELGIMRVLAKPYDPERLLRMVDSSARLVRLQRATQKLAQRSPRLGKP